MLQREIGLGWLAMRAAVRHRQTYVLDTIAAHWRVHQPAACAPDKQFHPVSGVYSSLLAVAGRQGRTRTARPAVPSVGDWYRSFQHITGSVP